MRKRWRWHRQADEDQATDGGLRVQVTVPGTPVEFGTPVKVRWPDGSSWTITGASVWDAAR